MKSMNDIQKIEEIVLKGLYSVIVLGIHERKEYTYFFEEKLKILHEIGKIKSLTLTKNKIK